MMRAALIVVFGLVLMIGSKIIGWTVSSERTKQHEAITTYRPTHGTVISAKIQPAGTASRFRFWHLFCWQPGQTHEVVIEYEYNVDGKQPKEIEFPFDRLPDLRVHMRKRLTGAPGGIHPPRGTRAWAENVLARYPPGKTCTVYYDPDPKATYEQAFLLREYDPALFTADNAFMVLFSLSVVAVWCAFCWLNGIRMEDMPYLYVPFLPAIVTGLFALSVVWSFTDYLLHAQSPFVRTWGGFAIPVTTVVVAVQIPLMTAAVTWIKIRRLMRDAEEEPIFEAPNFEAWGQ